MINIDNKSQTTGEKRATFVGELERLLGACCKTTGVPEPKYPNQMEDAGNYLVYLSKLTKQSGKRV